ncbi:flavin monoamine oxidase family protein [Massilia sp. SYSU DXS3249]
MQTARIAIIGGGLAGLYAAYLLEQQGCHDYVLLEAHTACGGRIISASASASAPPSRRGRMDLGPTWFWPSMQPGLDRLVRQLELERFAQYEEGDLLVERSPAGPPLRVAGYLNSPPSMRLAGGMQALTDALRSRLGADRILTGQTVRSLRAQPSHVELDSEDADGRTRTWQAEHVLLAVPPRLAAQTIAFIPALPQALARQWQATPTWMAPHAKYVAVYETPFWREQGLSGGARSLVGPLGELHDASIPGGDAALFGFFALPARLRRELTDEVLQAQCRAQLVRLFGPRAGAPTAEFIKDWASDPRTATAADLDAAGDHGAAPLASAGDGAWAGRLTGVASEWSRAFPGYVAGAVDAAGAGVGALPERPFR